MQTIELPNLNDNPKVSQITMVGDKLYTFNYEWIDDFCKLDILLGEKYIVKGKAITTASDLIGRVKDDELIKGRLYLINKYGFSIEPTQETFHSNFYLAWEA